MPSYLIVHSQPPGGRADAFAQPPTIDVSGLAGRLDWGDVTFEVPPGDHRVTISVVPVAGGREGAVLTVRVLPETGTRVSFVAPAAPGQPSRLHVDGQWPADAAMAYYAARDRRDLVPTGGIRQGGPQQAPPQQAPPQQPAPLRQPAPQQQQPRLAQPGVGVDPFARPAPQHPQSARPSADATPAVPAWAPPSPVPVAAEAPRQPEPSVPPVGPRIGSTGSVPIVGPASSAPTFGQMQGAVVEPGAQQQPPSQGAPTPAPAPRHAAAPPSSVMPPQHGRAQHGVAQPQQQSAFAPPQQASPFAPRQQGAAAPGAPAPQQPAAFGQPPAGHAPTDAHAFGASPMTPQQPPQQQPAFGHQAAMRRDVYGRDRADGDRSAPAIPTPTEFASFARAERERHEAAAIAASRQQQGWYPDPYGRSDVRWHDGERWTSSVLRQGRREHDPV